MDITKALIPSVFFCLFMSMSAHAAYPQACFQSEKDYQLWLKYGEEGPPEPDRLSADPTEEEWDKHDAQIDEYQYGRGKKASVSIRVTQTQASPGEKIIANASNSTTPSGKKAFSWGSSDIVSTTAEYSIKGGASGTYSNIQLTVTDPVCEVSASTQVRMTNK